MDQEMKLIEQNSKNLQTKLNPIKIGLFEAYSQSLKQKLANKFEVWKNFTLEENIKLSDLKIDELHKQIK